MIPKVRASNRKIHKVGHVGSLISVYRLPPFLCAVASLYDLAKQR